MSKQGKAENTSVQTIKLTEAQRKGLTTGISRAQFNDTMSPMDSGSSAVGASLQQCRESASNVAVVLDEWSGPSGQFRIVGTSNPLSKHLERVHLQVLGYGPPVITEAVLIDRLLQLKEDLPVVEGEFSVSRFTGPSKT